MTNKSLFAAILLGAVAFSSCVKDLESQSVTAIRNAKVTELNSIAALNNANAAAATTLANAQAQLLAAQAQAAAAEAELTEAQAALVNVKVDEERVALEVIIAQAEASKAEAAAAIEKTAADLELYLLQNQYDLLEAQKQLLTDATALQDAVITNYTNALSKLNKAEGELVELYASKASAEADLISYTDAYETVFEQNTARLISYALQKAAYEEILTDSSVDIEVDSLAKAADLIPATEVLLRATEVYNDAMEEANVANNALGTKYEKYYTYWDSFSWAEDGNKRTLKMNTYAKTQVVVATGAYDSDLERWIYTGDADKFAAAYEYKNSLAKATYETAEKNANAIIKAAQDTIAWYQPYVDSYKEALGTLAEDITAEEKKLTPLKAAESLAQTNLNMYAQNILPELALAEQLAAQDTLEPAAILKEILDTLENNKPDGTYAYNDTLRKYAVLIAQANLANKDTLAKLNLRIKAFNDSIAKLDKALAANLTNQETNKKNLEAAKVALYKAKLALIAAGYKDTTAITDKTNALYKAVVNADSNVVKYTRNLDVKVANRVAWLAAKKNCTDSLAHYDSALVSINTEAKLYADSLEAYKTVQATKKAFKEAAEALLDDAQEEYDSVMAIYNEAKTQLDSAGKLDPKYIALAQVLADAEKALSDQNSVINALKAEKEIVDSSYKALSSVQTVIAGKTAVVDAQKKEITTAKKNYDNAVAANNKALASAKTIIEGQDAFKEAVAAVTELVKAAKEAWTEMDAAQTAVNEIKSDLTALGDLKKGTEAVEAELKAVEDAMEALADEIEEALNKINSEEDAIEALEAEIADKEYEVSYLQKIADAAKAALDAALADAE